MSRYVRFKTEKRSGLGEQRKKLILFVVGAMLVFAGLCLIILAKNDFDVSSALGGNAETTTIREEETTQYMEKTEKSFLFWCSNSETGELEFIWVAKVVFPDCNVTVFSPAYGSALSFNGTETSISRIFHSFGEEGLKKAVEETYGIELSGYIGSGTETFKRMINYFGAVTVELDEPVEYRKDFNLILMKGKNTLKGDQLYKYMVYLGRADDAGIEKRGRVLMNIFDVVFTEKNFGRADDIYSKIANLLSTDVTVVNFSTSKNYIEKLFENGVSSGVVARSYNELRK